MHVMMACASLYVLRSDSSAMLFRTCISHPSVNVQALRRGHGLVVEAIDVGILSDIAFIGAVQLMPSSEDEWLPPVDRFFDLVRNPQCEAATIMRHWHQTFQGVPVIDLCLRHTGAISMTTPIPSAPPFRGFGVDYPRSIRSVPAMDCSAWRSPGLRSLHPRSLGPRSLRSLGRSHPRLLGTRTHKHVQHRLRFRHLPWHPVSSRQFQNRLRFRHLPWHPACVGQQMRISS